MVGGMKMMILGALLVAVFGANLTLSATPATVRDGPTFHTELSKSTGASKVSLTSGLFILTSNTVISRNVVITGSPKRGSNPQDPTHVYMKPGGGGELTFGPSVTEVTFKDIMFISIHKAFAVSNIKATFDGCEFYVENGPVVVKVDRTPEPNTELIIKGCLFQYLFHARSATKEEGGFVHLNLFNAAVTIENTVFSGQTADARYPSKMVVVKKGGCVFTSVGTSLYKGDAANTRARLTLTDLTFNGCVASETGGGMHIETTSHRHDYLHKVSVGMMTFNNCEAATGGGLHLDGIYKDDTYDFKGTTLFYRNIANQGGGMSINNLHTRRVTVGKVTFKYNAALSGGGLVVALKPASSQPIRELRGKFNFYHNSATQPDDAKASSKRNSNRRLLRTNTYEAPTRQLAAGTAGGKGGAVYCSCASCTDETSPLLQLAQLDTGLGCNENYAYYGGFLYAEADIYLFNFRSHKNVAMYDGGSFYGERESRLYNFASVYDQAKQGSGGGVFAKSALLEIDSAAFDGCTAKIHGGAVSSSPELREAFLKDAAFTGNRCEGQGQALYFGAGTSSMEVEFLAEVTIDGGKSTHEWGIDETSTASAVHINGGIGGITLKSVGTSYTNNIHGAIELASDGKATPRKMLFISEGDTFDTSSNTNSRSSITFKAIVEQVYRGTWFAGSCNAHASAGAIEERCNSKNIYDSQSTAYRHAPSYFGCKICPIVRRTCGAMPQNRQQCKTTSCTCPQGSTVVDIIPLPDEDQNKPHIINSDPHEDRSKWGYVPNPVGLTWGPKKGDSAGGPPTPWFLKPNTVPSCRETSYC